MFLFREHLVTPETYEFFRDEAAGAEQKAG
jgi:hypothetical protein